jgi:alpha-amylase
LQTTETVKAAKSNPSSLYNHYKKLLAIKKAYPEIARGRYTAININSFFVGGLLFTYNQDKVLVIHNTGENEFSIDLSTISTIETMTKLVSYVGKGQATIANNTLTIEGLTSAILTEM